MRLANLMNKAYGSKCNTVGFSQLCKTACSLHSRPVPISIGIDSVLVL